MIFREFMWLDGCTKNMYIFSLVNTELRRISKPDFLKNTFSTSLYAWSRAEATVETAEKSSSHLVLELLFSHTACVPLAKRRE